PGGRPHVSLQLGAVLFPTGVLAMIRSRSLPRQRRRRSLFAERLEPRILLATLPTGFTETAVATGISSGTAMELAPNGDLWVLQQGGIVKRFVPGSTTADVVGNLSTLGMSSS